MELRDRLQSTLGAAYSVERELGGGGMSRVFLARETALGRQVVVKLLDGDVGAGLSSERFAREVRLAASLQHPNIVPVLTTGVADGIPYYTMPYVKGESLRTRISRTGSLSRRQVLSILRDVARALEHAHGEGVIHRDIKPENILLSSDAAVVTDFGIAKAISAARTLPGAEARESSAGITLTQAGSSLGTPAYMAPEQVAGDAVDHRADLYAWGLIAYELLAGVHPFAGGATAAQVMAAQLAQSPAPLNDGNRDVTVSLAALVMQCLAKDPERRPSSAKELIDGLDDAFESREQSIGAKSRRRLTVTVSAAILLVISGVAYVYSSRSKVSATEGLRSVAVLPFADDRADSAEAYFGEGIADELMTALGKVPGLRVASRTSAVAVGKRRELDVREMGRQLGVSAIVEGTVRRAGNQLRVTAQLSKTSDGLALWSDVYERENKDVFAVQNDITRAIVAALRPELIGRGLATTRLSSVGTTDPEAYDLYLRGLFLIERRSIQQATEYFSRAIQQDSGFARAHAGLASALAFYPYFMGVPARQIEARLRAAAERSLQLDPTLAEPRVALAMAYWLGSRWTEAEREFQRALAADSGSAVAHTQYGRYLLSVGQVQNAMRHFRAARSLDPLAATSSVYLARSLAFMGDYPAALEEGKRARELDPNLWNNRTMAVFDLIDAGYRDQALAIIGNDIPPIAFRGFTAYALEVLGEKERAAMIRKSLDAAPDTTWLIHAARAYAYLATDTARALSAMEAAVDKEMFAQMLPFVDRPFDRVRHSERFAAIVRKAGLEGRGLTSSYGGRPAR